MTTADRYDMTTADRYDMTTADRYDMTTADRYDMTTADRYMTTACRYDNTLTTATGVHVLCWRKDGEHNNNKK